MDTRSKSTAPCWLLGNTIDSIQGNKLPSKGQTLRRLFHFTRNERKLFKDASSLTALEIMAFWEKARIPTSRVDNVQKKIKSLYDTYIGHQKNANLDFPKILEDRNEFVQSLNDLFDIAHKKAEDKIEIQQDKDFLELQRKKGRLGYMVGVDKKLTALEERREQKEAAAQKRYDKMTKQKEVETVILERSSSSSGSRSQSPSKRRDPDFVPEEPKPSGSKSATAKPSTSGQGFED